MYTTNVNMIFDNPQNVKNFVFTTSSLPNSMQIKIVQDDSVVDGKSILGILSLDFTKPVEVRFIYNQPINKDSIKQFNQWVVED